MCTFDKTLESAIFFKEWSLDRYFHPINPPIPKRTTAQTAATIYIVVFGFVFTN